MRGGGGGVKKSKGLKGGGAETHFPQRANTHFPQRANSGLQHFSVSSKELLEAAISPQP